jgi:Flp pilus assembly protein TadD
MRSSPLRVLVSAACLLWLAGCETTSQNGPGEIASAPLPEPETTGTLPPDPAHPPPQTPELLGKDPNDDLSVGKKYYREGSYGMAERHFRKAVEQHPGDAESWIGLAAAYDRLRRFDLADRAYRQAIKIAGPRAEILNNQGFSYMLRGDYVRARKTLLAAKAKDPESPYIQNNLDLLNKSQRKRKGIE